MPRSAEGWTLYRDKRTGVWIVRFRHLGQRYKRSTGETDHREAQKAAERIYAEIVSGRRQRPTHTSRRPLDVLAGEWLEEVCGTELSEATAEMYEGHLVHWVPFFRTLDGVVPESGEDYKRHRLRRVLRSTVKKELAGIRHFLRWCKSKGYLAELPALTDPTSKQIGTPYMGGKYAQKRVDLTPQQWEAWIEALPVRSKRGYPCRAFYRVIWETALRRGAVERLLTPDDYRPGDAVLQIRAAVDKARFGRSLPLTEAARDALDDACSTVSGGLIFGPRNYAKQRLAAALAIGLSEEDAKHIAHHDLRHGRATQLVHVTGDLIGAGYLLGHKHATTTNAYLHAKFEHASAALEAVRVTKRVTKRRVTKRRTG